MLKNAEILEHTVKILEIKCEVLDFYLDYPELWEYDVIPFTL